MSTEKQNPNDIFWLARYAHNQLTPLFEKAMTVEPTISHAVEIHFSRAESHYFDENALTISAWWNRDGMFQYSPRLLNKADVDRFVAKVEGDVAKLKPLDVEVAA